MNGRQHTHFRRNLGDNIPKPSWPVGVRLAQFDEKRHPKPAHDLLAEAYRQGGGDVGQFDDWWRSLHEDSEFDPTLFFLAVDNRACVIGLAQCWTSSFIKDLAVSVQWRRQGIGEALLLHTFNAFRARGALHVDLKVESDNPSGAARLYARLGMKPVP